MEEIDKINEVEKDDGPKIETTQVGYIPGKPYSKLKREISEDDLKHPAVQRLLLNEIDSLESKNDALNKFKVSFYQIDKDNAILKEKLKTHSAIEILYGFSLTIGSALLGLSSLIWDSGKGWTLILIGGILLIGGLISKFAKWK